MSQSHILLARGVSLPLNVVTQAIGIVAKRRAGKSYTARRMVEQLLRARQQVAIVDPKGDWWGIRSAADGKRAGWPVVIVGGERGDVPLEAGGGEIVAKLVVEERVSVLLDLSLLRKHEVATFMTAFLETLYRLKAREALRTPLMLVVDEADAIMPQKPQPNEARMLGAGEDIVRRGGQRGIGCALITQRTAVLNKNVLTQCEMIIALRTIAPQDLKALDAWIEVHGTEREREKLMRELPSMPVGVACFWSPGWPTSGGIFEIAKMLPIETFDSGATPTSGERRVEPKTLADIDLKAVTRQMAATIERAKADDPKALRAEIVKLKQELAREAKPVSQPKADLKKAIATAHANGVSVGIAAERKRWRVALRFFRQMSEQIVIDARDQTTLSDRAIELLKKLDKGSPELPTPAPDIEFGKRDLKPEQVRAAFKPELIDSSIAHPRVVREHGSAQQRVLQTIAEIMTLGVAEAPRTQVAAFMNYHERTPTFTGAVSALIASGDVVIPSAGKLALTERGKENAPRIEPITSKDDLMNRWLRAFDDAPVAQMIVRHLSDIRSGEGFIRRDELAQKLNYHVRTPTFTGALSRLKQLGAVRFPSPGSVALTSLVLGD